METEIASYTDFLLGRLRETAENPALAVGERVITGSELFKAVHSAKSTLINFGCQSGNVIILHGDFSINSVAFLLALIDMETIIVPLTLQTKKNVNEQISELTPDYIVDTYADVSIETMSFGGKTNKYIEQLKNEKKPGLILYTSGSTGKPKAVVHDFSKLLKKFTLKRPALVTLNFLLFDHWGGLNTLLHSLSNSSMLVLPDADRNVDTICKLIEKFKIELLPATPSFLNMLILSGAFKRHDLSSLRIISYGAEPMPESTLKAVLGYFPNVDLRQTYGMIELGVLRAKSENNSSLWVKLGGEGYDLRVVDGILQIKSDSTMLGYVNAPMPVTEDGYFITGDMVEQQGEYLKILGRKSDIINIGGQKVYPSEIETVLLQIDEVEDATVVGETHALMGSIVVANIKTTGQISQNELIRKIKRECARQLQRYMVPSRINITNNSLQNYRLKRQR